MRNVHQNAAQIKHASKKNVGKRLFIVDTSARMLRKNPELSKNARQLYLTLRSLADGKSGELRIGDRWLKAITFETAAEICRNVRLRAMRELMVLGLVTVTRPRVLRVIGGRIRSVAGPVRYTVHRDPVPVRVPFPKNDQNPNDSSTVPLLQSLSCTVQEKDPQFFPITPCTREPSVGVVAHVETALPLCERNRRRPESPVKTDDDEVRTKQKAPTKKKIKPALRSWMRSRILGRATEIGNRHAYLRTAEAEFLENLPLEIEDFF